MSRLTIDLTENAAKELERLKAVTGHTSPELFQQALELYRKKYTVKRYVCGFMFNQEKTQVVLIRKLRPEWQKGKLNGVGGHIEDGEKPEEAMSREFEEEAGISDTKWTLVAEYDVRDTPESDQAAQVYFFKSFGDIHSICSRTDEEVIVYPVSEIFSHLHSVNVLLKLRFLIPMCLNEEIFIPFKFSGKRDK